MFFMRMANHFYENNYVNEPKLSHLAKACLNIVGNKFAKVEEITYDNWVQRQLARARGTNAPYVGYEELHTQQSQTMDESFRRDASRLIPPELRRAPPVDKVKTPEVFEV